MKTQLDCVYIHILFSGFAIFIKYLKMAKIFVHRILSTLDNDDFTYFTLKQSFENFKWAFFQKYGFREHLM